MELKITPHHFLELAKRAYSLDMIYLLTLLDQDYDITPLCVSARIKNVAAGLMRKGLINSEGISLLGKDLLKFTASEEKMSLPKKITHNDSFDIWWKVYPGTDGFTYRNKTFPLTRNLRGDKTSARRHWHTQLDKGEYTAEEIIEATKFDIAQRKEMSVKKSRNQLTFMQNSATYMYQGTFSAFADHIKEGGTVQSISSRAKEIDI